MADDAATAEEQEKQEANDAIRAEAAAAKAGKPKEKPAKADEPEKPKEKDEDEDLGPEGVKALEAFKDRARKAERKVKEYEDAQKSEEQKRDEKLADLEKESGEWKDKFLRLKVGTEKGLSPVLAERLRGDDESEMAKDADRLLEQVKPKTAGDSDAGKGEADDTSWNDAIRAQAARR